MNLPNAAQGYARYFGGELASDRTVLIVAEKADAIVGYVYARMEPRSYNELLDAADGTP